jgi:pimeloyl-ACP methyl ester carboxylesterase
VLIHGGLTTIDQMQGWVQPLAKTRHVIAVEMHGHGRTADTDRPMILATMGDDIAALRGVFAVPKADLVGHSFGGDTHGNPVARLGPHGAELVGEVVQYENHYASVSSAGLRASSSRWPRGNRLAGQPPGDRTARSTGALAIKERSGAGTAGASRSRVSLRACGGSPARDCGGL